MCVHNSFSLNLPPTVYRETVLTCHPLFIETIEGKGENHDGGWGWYWYGLDGNNDGAKGV